MKNKFIIGILFSILLLLSPGVKAANFTDNQTVDVNKTWTIKFTDEVGFDDLTKQSIAVTDSSGNKVNVGIQMGQDNKTITVTAPQGGYTAGESYILDIKNQVHSSKGKALKKEYKLHFNIENDNTEDNIYSFTSAEDLSKKEFIDLKSGQIRFDGNNVTARLNLRGIPSKVKFNLATTKDYYDEYRWGVYISCNTGDYILVAHHYKKPGSTEIEMPIQDGVENSVEKVNEGSFKQGDWNSVQIGEANLIVDEKNDTLTLDGQIPGLDPSKVSYIRVENSYDAGNDYSDDKVILFDK